MSIISEYRENQDPVEPSNSFWKPIIGETVCVKLECQLSVQSAYGNNNIWRGIVVESDNSQHKGDDHIFLPSHANLITKMLHVGAQEGDLFVIERTTDTASKKGNVVFQYKVWKVKESDDIPF